MSDRDQFIAPLLQRLVAQTVELAGKNQVLVHRQLIVEREFLRHVADHFFDRLAFAGDIAAADASDAFRRLEDAAEHPDDGRFAGTVRTKEAENGAAWTEKLT